MLTSLMCHGYKLASFNWCYPALMTHIFRQTFNLSD